MKQIWFFGLGLVKSSSASFHSWIEETNQSCEHARVVGALVLLPSQFWTSCSSSQPFPACPSGVLGAVVMLSPTVAHPGWDVTRCSGPCCTALAVPHRQHGSSLRRVPLLALLSRASSKVGGLVFSEK